MNKIKVIAIIPARGGSKRVPRKNVRDLAGKPLIAWSIKAAKESKHIDRVFVTSDDDEILKVSEKFGAEIVRRPDELAQDKSPTNPVIIHLLDSLEKEGYVPDLFILLQPTSPMRTKKDIDEAIELFFKSKADSLVSVMESNPYWTFTLENNKAIPVFDWKYFKMRSQDIPKTYELNGSIYIISPDLFRKNNGFLNENTAVYPMSAKKSIDIDEEIDFKIAQLMMEEKE